MSGNTYSAGVEFAEGKILQSIADTVGEDTNLLGWGDGEARRGEGIRNKWEMHIYQN